MVRFTGHTANVREQRNAYVIFIIKPYWKRTRRGSRCRRYDPSEQIRSQWPDIVNTAMEAHVT